MQLANYFDNKKLLAITLSIIVFGIGLSTNYAEAKVDENKCKFYYEKYKELKESKFLQKYKNKSFTYDCLKLYKDPNWSFVGKNKIDKNYEKLDALLSVGSSQKLDVKILSMISIGQEKYLVKFRTCSYKQSVVQPAYLITSKIEQFVATSNKVLQERKCYDHSVQIKAKSSSNIQI
ncbi:MAG: hypothetical protein QW652_02100, partial [Candidatus Nitrosotenuis sp.]